MSVEIINANCMDYLAECETGKFDLAVVDPPYGINISRTGLGAGLIRSGKNARKKTKAFYGADEQPPPVEYFRELQRVSTNQIIWGANYFIDRIPSANSKCWIVWHKRFSPNVTFSPVELAWTSFKEKSGYHSEASTFGRRGHPTQKPVGLYEYIFTTYAKPGCCVLDTHLGSGSAAVAANRMGVDFVGVEMMAKYAEMAKAWVEEDGRQQRLF